MLLHITCFTIEVRILDSTKILLEILQGGKEGKCVENQFIFET